MAVAELVEVGSVGQNDRNSCSYLGNFLVHVAVCFVEASLCALQPIPCSLADGFRTFALFGQEFVEALFNIFTKVGHVFSRLSLETGDSLFRFSFEIGDSFFFRKLI